MPDKLQFRNRESSIYRADLMRFLVFVSLNIRVEDLSLFSEEYIKHILEELYKTSPSHYLILIL